MCKSVLMIAAAVAIVSAGSLVSSRAHAGASASAPTKVTKVNQVVHSGRHGRPEITEYSSSSATYRPPRQ